MGTLRTPLISFRDLWKFPSVGLYLEPKMPKDYVIYIITNKVWMINCSTSSHFIWKHVSIKNNSQDKKEISSRK